MKSTRTVFYYSCFVISIAFSACAPAFVYKSMWQSTPVTIDGRAKEWSIPLNVYDTKTRLNFSVSNDAATLYICLRITDEQMQKGIMHYGLQLWIDTAGKKSDATGILFPLVQNRHETADGQNEGQRKNTENTNGGQQFNYTAPDTTRLNRMHRSFLSESKEIRVKGFKVLSDGLLELPDEHGIKVALNWDSAGTMIYEEAIPFGTFLRPTLIAKDTNKVLGITFSFNVVAQHTNGGGEGMHGGHGGGGMHGGGMGGSMGGSGGMRGGGGHGGGEGSSEPERQVTWVPFKLALKN